MNVMAEIVEITAADGSAMPAHTARPVGSHRATGVIVAHELSG
jgi:dienelactone hydrolase